MCIYPNIKHRLYSINASIIPLYIHSAAVFCPIRQPTTTFHFTSSPPLLLSLSHSPLLLSVSSGNHHWPSLAAYELIGEILLNTRDKKLPKKEKEKKKVWCHCAPLLLWPDLDHLQPTLSSCSPLGKAFRISSFLLFSLFFTLYSTWPYWYLSSSSLVFSWPNENSITPLPRLTQPSRRHLNNQPHIIHTATTSTTTTINFSHIHGTTLPNRWAAMAALITVSL